MAEAVPKHCTAPAITFMLVAVAKRHPAGRYPVGTAHVALASAIAADDTPIRQGKHEGADQSLPRKGVGARREGAPYPIRYRVSRAHWVPVDASQVLVQQGTAPTAVPRLRQGGSP